MSINFLFHIKCFINIYSSPSPVDILPIDFVLQRVEGRVESGDGGGGGGRGKGERDREIERETLM